MKLNMEVVEEIWVARVRGQEGEVELTIMPYYYCNLWDVFLGVAMYRSHVYSGCPHFGCLKLVQGGHSKAVAEELSQASLTWELTAKSPPFYIFFPSRRCSSVETYIIWTSRTTASKARSLQTPFGKNMEWHPPNDIFENWVSEISWPNSDWCISSSTVWREDFRSFGGAGHFVQRSCHESWGVLVLMKLLATKTIQQEHLQAEVTWCNSSRCCCAWSYCQCEIGFYYDLRWL